MTWGSKLLVSPVGPGLVQGRTDQGVDYSGSGPLYAVGSGTIVSTTNSGWPGGTFIGLLLDNPSDATHQLVYYAEDIVPSVSVGQRVNAGQLVGNATGGSSGIEIGWGSPSAIGQPLNQAEYGVESGATPEGTNFLNAISGAATANGGSTVTGSGSASSGTSSASSGGIPLLNLPLGQSVTLPGGLATRIILAILGIIVLLIAVNKLFDSKASAPEVIQDGSQQASQQIRQAGTKAKATANAGRSSNSGPPIGNNAKPKEAPKVNAHEFAGAA